MLPAVGSIAVSVEPCVSALETAPMAGATSQPSRPGRMRSFTRQGSAHTAGERRFAASAAPARR